MAERIAISKRTRFEVFKRDQFTCQYCGRTPPAVLLHVDHITAVANGGDNDEINLITSCVDCNLGKSDVPLGTVPKPLSDEILRRKEMTEQVEAYNEMLMFVRESREHWIDGLTKRWYDSVDPHNPGGWSFGPARLASIRRFLDLLPAAKIHEAMDIALSRHPASIHHDDATWRYFCGVCWRTIKGVK